jgi:hypothetical protein
MTWHGIRAVAVTLAPRCHWTCLGLLFLKMSWRRADWSSGDGSVSSRDAMYG